MKRALDFMYTKYIPKGAFPFIYLSLRLNTRNLDVNVHPTKQRVFFVDQDKIIASICTAIQDLLARSNHSRVFNVPTIDLTPIASSSRIYPHDKVRVDHRARKINMFFEPISKRTKITNQVNSQIIVDSNRNEPLDIQATHESESDQLLHESQELLSEQEPNDELEYNQDLEEEFHNIGERTIELDILQSSSLNEETNDIQPQILDADHDEQSQIRRYTHGTNSDYELEIIESKSTIHEIDDWRDDFQENSTKENEGFEKELLEQKVTYQRTWIVCQLESIKGLLQQVYDKEHAGITAILQNMVIVGAVDDRLSLIQHQTEMYLVDMDELNEEMHYQIILRGFGNFAVHYFDQGVPIDAIEKTEMLEEYFGIVVKNGYLVGLPALNSKGPRMNRIAEFIQELPCVNYQNEIECFRGVSRVTAKLYQGSDFCELVGQVGMNVKMLTSTRELYKIFERC